MNYLLYLTIVLFFGCAAGMNYTKCGTEPTPLQLNIKNCEKQPCTLVRGSVAKITMDIYANGNLTSLKAKVRAYWMGQSVNYPLPKNDVCQYLLNGECPLDEGEVVTYFLEMPILQTFPQIKALAEFSINSEYGVVSCFKINIEVV